MDLGTSRYVGVSNRHHYYPIVKGGQGRSAPDVEWGSIYFGVICFVLVIFMLACFVLK